MDLSDEKIVGIYLDNKKDYSSFAALATCKTLMHFLIHDNSTTLQEISVKIQKVIYKLKEIEPLTEVESLSEIFLRFITLTASEYHSINEVKKALKSRGDLFLEKLINCQQKIAHFGHPFISEDSSILIHSRSQVVFETLCEAQKAKKRFFVFITQSCPDKSGEEMYDMLVNQGISCKLILDAAVGYYMEKVDMVLVGAEGVVENGGIINKIGTFPLALCAKAFNKPFYVLAESYKFIRHFPLKQADIPPRIKYKNSIKTNFSLEFNTPLVDYTPPEHITLLHTDLGTLTTAAVSDVLMQLYL